MWDWVLQSTTADGQRLDCAEGAYAAGWGERVTVTRRNSFLLGLLALVVSPLTQADDSQCFGSVAKGRIEHSVKLPVSGANFSAYSSLAAAAGRTYVHGRVAQIIRTSYAALAAASPETRYVYGETGWASGGRLRPHRTHQNGLSVDFFVPVRNAQGKSVELPTRVTSRFGYDIEFDAQGRYEGYTMDLPAMAEHLYQLHLAAKSQGVGIALVIFDQPYLAQLFATARGPYLQQHLRFMKGKPWVRHDEHYHLDFDIPCKPMAG